PKNALVKQYECLFKMDGIQLKINDDVLDFVVDKTIEYKLGARGLRSIMETILTDAMYDLPSNKKVKNWNIDLKYAEKQIEKFNFSNFSAE
ncbi:MAG: ATP-dependent Clp protease ATP-binding subunit ClpX, partial [Bacteroidales bacterium]|nr:ATP-dependent Clp protease ATP-binding subunit ClpX [Bacteroidales bacterium]